MICNQVWNDYIGIYKVLAVVTIAAMVLHWLWMPYVIYDPWAPFRIFYSAAQGGYFPVAALIAWVAGMAKQFPGARAGATLRSLVIVYDFPIMLFLVGFLIWFMDWRGALNALALTVWVILMRQTATTDLKSLYGRIFEWLLISLAFACGSYVFTVGKAFLFYIRQPLDSEIIGAELMIFGKPEIHTRIAELGSRLSEGSLQFLEAVYFQFFSHILIVSIYLDARRDFLARRRYVVAMIICYLLGVAMYYIVPGLGPAFYEPDKFLYLIDGARDTRQVQDILKYNTDAARDGFRSLQSLDVYAFIACMPSLHIAHESVMLFFSRGSLAALLFSFGFMVATCFAVLVLGWHYILDIPFGGFLGLLSVFLSYLIVRANEVNFQNFLGALVSRRGETVRELTRR